MLSTLLIIGGVLVGLLVLLALIVALSARPTTKRADPAAAPTSPGWVAHAGRKHPDPWSPQTNTSTEIRAIR